MKNKYNCIVTVEESEKLKEFCIKNGIEWFRTEYYDKRYFQINATEKQKEMIDKIIEGFENE